MPRTYVIALFNIPLFNNQLFYYEKNITIIISWSIINHCL